MAHLLIVDDDSEVTASLRLVLERHHVVKVAGNGEEGLRLLNERRPDLILLDVEMPVLDGPDMAYRMFVEDAGREKIPIILVSGVPNLERVAQRVGTPYYLLKPVDIEPLFEIVQRALIERRAPRPAIGRSLANRER
jgi:DNA-binding NtrC family response regulator